MEAYKQAAPQLLNELARLLWQHRWADERRLPRGVVNILNCSWHDLTAGALRSSPKLTDKLPKSVGSPKLQQPPRQVSASGREETAEEIPCAAGSAGFTGRKSQVKLNPRVKKSEQRCSRGKRDNFRSHFCGHKNTAREDKIPGRYLSFSPLPPLDLSNSPYLFSLLFVRRVETEM